eukprot:m51a1_g13582 hypothetical protein (165) ;mRNA; r:512-2105
MPIGFYSRVLTLAKLNFLASELKCLSAVWITKKLRHLISFSPFKLELNMDHRGLVMLLMKKELGNAWLECWVMHLQLLCMRIRYLAGKSTRQTAGVQVQHNTHMPIDIATKGLARLHKLTAYIEDLKHKTAAAHKAAQEFKKDYRAAVQRRYNMGRIDPCCIFA